MATSILTNRSSNLSLLSAVNINYSTLTGSTIIDNTMTVNRIHYSTITGSSVATNSLLLASTLTGSSIILSGNVLNSGTSNLTVATQSTGLLILNSQGGALALQSGGVTYASVDANGLTGNIRNGLSDLTLGYISSGWITLETRNQDGQPYPTAQYGNQSCSFGWNGGSLGGEYDFMNNYGNTVGNPGGFAFYNRTSNTTKGLIIRLGNANSPWANRNTPSLYQLQIPSTSGSINIGAFYTSNIGFKSCIQSYDAGAVSGQDLHLNPIGGAIYLGATSFSPTFVNGGLTIFGGNQLVLYDSSNSIYRFSTYCQNTDLGQGSGSNYVIYSDQKGSGWYLYYNNSSGVWGVASDETLKKDITPAEPMMNKILQLQPVSFRWNNQQDTDNPVYGFIAQEYKKIFPNDVGIDETTGKLNANYGHLFTYIVKAFQEQNDVVVAQATRIETLESQLSQVLQRLAAAGIA